MVRWLFALCVLGLVCGLRAPLLAEVRRVEVEERSSFSAGQRFGSVGEYEVLRGRVFFSVDPRQGRNRHIADIGLAPRNAQGEVEFSSDFVVLQPKDAAQRRPAALLEVLNRGTSEEEGFFLSLEGGGLMDLPTLKKTRVADGFVFEQGFTMAYLGWETTPGIGTMKMVAPSVAVQSQVRATIVTDDTDANTTEQPFTFPEQECPDDSTQPAGSSW